MLADLQFTSIRKKTNHPFGPTFRIGFLSALRHKFELFHLTQMDQMGCGPTCLRMVSAKFGNPIDSRSAARAIPISRVGVSVADMVEGGQRIGIDVEPRWVPAAALAQIKCPAILLWRQSHYIVYWGMRGNKYLVSDPAASGKICIGREDIDAYWVISEASEGIVLSCMPNSEFLNLKGSEYQAMAGSTSRALLRYFAGQRERLTTLGLWYLLIVATTVAMPILITSIYGLPASHQTQMHGMLLLLSVVGLQLARFVFELARSRTLLRLSEVANEKMLGRFLARVFSFTFLQFSHRKLADYLMKLDAHERVRLHIKSPSFYIVFDVITMAAALLLLWSIERPVALTYAATLLAIVSAALIGLPKARQLRFQGYNIQSTNRTLEMDILRGMQDIKVARQELAFQKRWERQVHDAHLIDDAQIALRETQRSFSILALSLCSVICLVLMIAHVRSGSANPADLLFVTIVLGLVSVPTQQFAEFVRSVDDIAFYLRQLEEIHDEIDSEDSRAEELVPPPLYAGSVLHHGLLLRRVRFAYRIGRSSEILKGVDLTVKCGRTVAIFGASGSGKSTLAKVAAGIYQPTDGSAVWQIGSDKNNLMKVGAVLQDSTLFTLPAKDNIAFGQPHEDVDERWLKEVIRISALSDVIERLPMGLKTLLGASGHQVSGGECQRILIARALYNIPDLLVLDEATNALDKQTEAQIISAIRSEFPRLAILLVSHSAALARLADEVVVLKGGLINAHGRHDDLATTCTTYKRLLRLGSAKTGQRKSA
jgi:ATP-binding cassette, subfamily B, bacterial